MLPNTSQHRSASCAVGPSPCTSAEQTASLMNVNIRMCYSDCTDINCTGGSLSYCFHLLWPQMLLSRPCKSVAMTYLILQFNLLIARCPANKIIIIRRSFCYKFRPLPREIWTQPSLSLSTPTHPHNRYDLYQRRDLQHDSISLLYFLAPPY